MSFKVIWFNLPVNRRRYSQSSDAIIHAHLPENVTVNAIGQFWRKFVSGSRQFYGLKRVKNILFSSFIYKHQPLICGKTECCAQATAQFLKSICVLSTQDVQFLNTDCSFSNPIHDAFSVVYSVLLFLAELLHIFER